MFIRIQARAIAFYISDIIVRHPMRVSDNNSVVFNKTSGQMPDRDNVSASMPTGINMPVRGRAIRFVSRKCSGNVPK